MMGLRLVDGVDADEVADRSGLDPRGAHAEAFSRFVDQGLLEVDGATIRLTPAGMDVLNAVLVELTPG